mmetsp:Transcript_40885/g.60030  ORF Transcript_40885/g.60030 Transcript_40885/m.60030 type:complete len:202 (-) Transcript_40885:138-743(-)|eukprot:CAMPEP_0195525780 /NCGR_PEP_ID=MMETSP0794_2-20130614/26392_1 /TAXON_ID=515487 /ORGANISM="Stephanopyxis turris, Strain CCMP 815" /LENGTH=201 /DNA_ID=CAMNT_0040656311 /DNA_START=145 /DNA_END=750 /DNA_ORIENTATION=+
MRVTTIRCRGVIALLLLVTVLSLAFLVISAEGEGVAEVDVASSADITIDEAATESTEPVGAEDDFDDVVEEEGDTEEDIEEEEIEEELIEEEDTEEEFEEMEAALNLEEVKVEAAAILEKAAAIETEQVTDEPEVVEEEEEEEPVAQEEISAVVDESEKKGKSVIEKIRSMTSQDAKKVAAAGLGIWGAGAGIHWAMQRGG